MLCCNIHLAQLPGPSGCYVVQSISINFQDGQDISVCYVVTSISFNFQDALDATLHRPREATSQDAVDAGF